MTTGTGTETGTGISAGTGAGAGVGGAPRGAGGALRILAEAARPPQGGGALPPVPGFVGSGFNPLVVGVAERCLRRALPAPQVRDAARAGRIALVPAGAGGDRGTARALADAVAHGERVPTLLFFQSDPNAVLGHVAARWGPAGPLVCLGPAPPPGPPGPPEPGAAGTAAAAALIGAGGADEALVIAAGQDGGPHAAGAAGSDRARALLVAGDG